jgi:hypothetical protein
MRPPAPALRCSCAHVVDAQIDGGDAVRFIAATAAVPQSVSRNVVMTSPAITPVAGSPIRSSR